ncbi:MAG: hypothetical protein ACI9U2_001541 [Bradymonadia bacterium]|jgi:hypothetical protein
MAHRLRYVQSGAVYEVVRRTHRGRYAFVPSAALVRELRGVIGEAHRRFPRVKVHVWCWLSTHFHALLSATGPYAANAIAAWLNYVMSQSARVAQAINGVRGRIWEGKPCRLIQIRDDAQMRERSKYIMAQATAAGLVARPNQWPGLNTCDALCRGERMMGYLGSAALRRQAARDKVAMASIAPRREVRLSPLPIHAGWPEYQRQRWYQQIEREIIEETAAANPGRRYPAPEHYTTICPHTEKDLPDSPAPQCWVGEGNHEARRSWRAEIRAFTDTWREALADWVNGARACFPVGGWVPFGACYAPGYPQRE